VPDQLVQVIQLLLLGLLLGGVYALLASGLALIVGVMRFLNLAHGEFMILSGLSVWGLWTSIGLNPLVGIIVVTPVAFLAGASIERVVLERVINKPESTAMLITFGLSMLLRSLGVLVFSLSLHAVPYMTDTVTIGPFFLPQVQVLGFGVAMLVYLGVYVALHRTQFGRALRAVAQNQAAAAASGIDARRVRSLAFGVGCGLAAIAGGLMILNYPLSPESAFSYVLKAFVAGMLGGLGSYIGALFGGLLLGVAEIFIGFYLTAQWAQAFTYVLLVVLLLVRPRAEVVRAS
jgi:branched-chain amino acid transport system permease protein